MTFTEEFRPQKISELYGQDSAKKVIGAFLRTGRIPSTILIAGDTSAGKTTSARIIGKALMCSSLKDGESCGECTNCKNFMDGTHPDYMELDSAVDRGIDAVKNLISKIAYFPAMAEKKVIVFDECHQLTAPAWQALLKTLESPPSHLLIILCTTNPEKLPNTILGRSSRIHLVAITNDACTDLLKLPYKKYKLKKMGLSKNHLQKLAHAVGNHPRNALHVLDQVYTMLLDSSNNGKNAVEDSMVNSFIEASAGVVGEGHAVGIARLIAQGRVGKAIKTFIQIRGNADYALKVILETLRNIAYGSISPKLVESYYAKTVDNLPILEMAGGRAALVECLDLFVTAKMNATTYSIPLSDSLDVVIMKACGICAEVIAENEEE